jgi:superfamily II DNA or RNA helicase
MTAQGRCSPSRTGRTPSAARGESRTWADSITKVDEGDLAASGDAPLLAEGGGQAGLGGEETHGTVSVMADPLGPGLWEELLTEGLAADLAGLDPLLRAQFARLTDADAADRLSRHVAGVLARLIDAQPETERRDNGVAFARALITRLGELVDARRDPGRERPVVDAQVLQAILRPLPTGDLPVIERPLTPILDTTLLTNSRGEPAMAHELRAEIASADSIDVVMAFVRRSGILPLMDGLRRHAQAGRRLRVLTTTYTGTTEARALDDLRDLGAEVRVSYDETSTRLHAKAWVFHRAPSTTTAYIGSSNLTHTAQHSGLEWNVRVASARNPDVVAKMTAVFDSYWENGDFVDYDPDEFARRTQSDRDGPALLLSPVGIELRPFQEGLLERIDLARHQGHHRNLLVAATGTGKTVMAAVDYARLRGRLPRARLLFVAHREELLTQARATFAHAVRDAAFGELWVRGKRPVRFDHVFASVQTLSGADLGHLDPDHFDVVVIDEFHHAAALTYRALLDRLAPAELLGLTATPDRADGLDVLGNFDGRIAAELRLWDAIDAAYLAPFSYYGIHDGVDLQAVPWVRGRGYDAAALTGVLTADHAWAHLVIEQVRQKVTDPRRMRALGFCVSVAHARFMAERFAAAGIPAVAVWGETPFVDRQTALNDLTAGRVAVVFTVDLFNEGIDVPDVDTLLLLRPTDSGTLFLQQLGRGLRRSPGKATCTVLDFVSLHRTEFRYDRRFGALLGTSSRSEIEREIQGGFPYLPAGTSIELDPVAREIVLRSIRDALPSTWRTKVAELAGLGDVDLAAFLDRSGLDLPDVYPNQRSWSELRRTAGLSAAPAGPDEVPLLRAVGRLTHVDDLERITSWTRWLASAVPPDVTALDERDRRLVRMLIGSLSQLPVASSLEEGVAQVWAHPQVRSELGELLGVLGGRIAHLDHPLGIPGVPLRVHARYTRTEILRSGSGPGCDRRHGRKGCAGCPTCRLTCWPSRWTSPPARSRRQPGTGTTPSAPSSSTGRARV